MINDEAAEQLPCPHGRETWRICPHCLGINRTDPDSEKIQRIAREHGRPQLEDMSREELVNLLGKIGEQCTHALDGTHMSDDDHLETLRAWLRTIWRTALQREDV